MSCGLQVPQWLTGFALEKTLKNRTCTKTFIDHLYLPTEVSNSRARFHTFLKHFSCPRQWSVFLSEQLCSCATVEGRMLQIKSTLEERMSTGVQKRHLPSHHSLKTKSLMNLHSNERQNRQGRVQMNSSPKTSRSDFFLQIDLPYVLTIGTSSPSSSKMTYMSQLSTKWTIIQI